MQAQHGALGVERRHKDSVSLPDLTALVLLRAPRIRAEAVAEVVRHAVQLPLELAHIPLGGLLLQALHITDDLLRVKARLFDDGPRLLLGLPLSRALHLLHLPVEALGLVLHAHGLFAGFLRQLLLLFGDLPMVFRVGDHVLELDRVVVQQFPRIVDQVLAQAQLAGDLKGVGFARHTDAQAVGGPESIDIKLHRSVLHALCGQGIRLELAVMGRGDGRDPLCREMAEHGLGQGGALGGIRAGAQLVKEHQVLFGDGLKDADDIGHMGREGREALFDGLLVADIGVHLPEQGDLAAVGGGDVQAALGHQRQKADGLEGDGLAAGVGAGDHEGPEPVADPEIEGHHALPVDQGMAGPHKAHLPVRADLGAHCLHVFGKGGFGEDEIQFGEDLQIAEDLGRVPGHLPGQGKEDPLDLGLFLGLPALDLVAKLHDGHGLDIQRGTGRALIMHKARHVLPELLPDREHIAPVADRHDIVHQVFGRAAAVGVGVQLIPDALVAQPDMPADVGKVRAGAVGDLVFPEHGVIDALPQRP